MAFTSEGMFYLGKEDLAPTIGMVGTGVRGMLGVQNEEEAVKALMSSSDLESSEGRQSFLNQLQGISPDAHKEFSKQFQDYDVESLKGKAYAQQVEIQSKSLQMKQEEREANKRIPQLKTNYKFNEEAKDIKYFLRGLYPEDEKGITGIDSIQKAKQYLSKANAAAGHVKSLNHDVLVNTIKFNRDSYINQNKYNPVEKRATLTTAGQDVFNLPARQGTPNAPIQGEILKDAPANVVKHSVATPDKSQFIPLGTQDTPGITQVDMEASAIDKVLNPPIAQAAEDLKGILSNTFSTIDVQGSDKSEYDMTKTERTKENKLDALRDFLGNGSILTSSAHQYFSKNPKELVNFNKNPMMWFMKNVSPKGYDYSEYNLLGN